MVRSWVEKHCIQTYLCVGRDLTSKASLFLVSVTSESGEFLTQEMESFRTMVLNLIAYQTHLQSFKKPPQCPGYFSTQWARRAAAWECGFWGSGHLGITMSRRKSLNGGLWDGLDVMQHGTRSSPAWLCSPVRNLVGPWPERPTQQTELCILKTRLLLWFLILSHFFLNIKFIGVTLVNKLSGFIPLLSSFNLYWNIFSFA